MGTNDTQAPCAVKRRYMAPRLCADLVVTAFEGGCNYWIERADPHFVDGCKRQDYALEPLYDNTMFWEDGNGFKIKGEDDDAVNLLTMAKMAEALPKLADEHQQNLVDENWDAITADCIVQLAVFGELVYG